MWTIMFNKKQRMGKLGEKVGGVKLWRVLSADLRFGEDESSRGFKD
jgi:hypothetical protein